MLPPCTVGGNQARSDARSEFEILEPSPKGGGVKLVVPKAVKAIIFSQIGFKIISLNSNRLLLLF